MSAVELDDVGRAIDALISAARAEAIACVCRSRAEAGRSIPEPDPALLDEAVRRELRQIIVWALSEDIGGQTLAGVLAEQTRELHDVAAAHVAAERAARERAA